MDAYLILVGIYALLFLFGGVISSCIFVIYIYSNPEEISLSCEEPTDINWSLAKWGGANSPTKLKLWPWTHLRLFNRQKRYYSHADSPQDADIYSTTLDIWWICRGLWWIMPDDSPFTTLQSSSQCYLSSSGWFSIGKPRGEMITSRAEDLDELAHCRFFSWLHICEQ